MHSKKLSMPLFMMVFIMGLIISWPVLATYYGSDLCGYPDFKCAKVHRGDTWQKLFPDPRQKAMIMRLNRTNMALSNRSWIVVPTKLNEISYLDLSPFPTTIKPPGERTVVVNLGLEAFAAYEADGKLVHWGPASGGKDWCPDIQKPCQTAFGTYKIFRKQGPECVSSKFPISEDGGAPMPYCMHYLNGFALHGSEELPGYNASHGCVRLFVDDAQWLNENFTKIGTPVTVLP